MDVYGAREDPVPGRHRRAGRRRRPAAGRTRCCSSRPGRRPRRRWPRGPGPATWCSPWAPATSRWSGPRCWRRCARGRPGRTGRRTHVGRPVSRTGTTTRDRTAPVAASGRAPGRRRRLHPAAAPAAAPRAPVRRAGRCVAVVLLVASSAGRCSASPLLGVRTVQVDGVDDAARRPGAGGRRHRPGDAAAAGRRRRGRGAGRPAAAGGLGRGHPRLAAHRRHHRGRAGRRGGRRASPAGGRWSTPRACSSTRSPGRRRPASSRSTSPTPGPGDPATMAALAAVEALPDGPARPGRPSAAAPTRRGHHPDPRRRHARALGRPGAVRRKAAALAGAARADRRRRPGAGRHHRRQHAEGRRPPLTGPARRAHAGVRSAAERASATRPPSRHARHATSLFRVPDLEAHHGSGPRHETFAGRVVTPSGAGCDQWVASDPCDPRIPTRRPRRVFVSASSPPPNFVLVDQVDITVRLNLRMRVQLGSAA